MKPFEGDTYLADDYTQIIKYFKPTLLIETGTHLGNTTEYMATFNLPVMAIEKDENFYNITKSKVQTCLNVQVILGDSPTVLEKNYDYLKTHKILAFLDAHWGGGLTLERELTFIKKLPIKPFLIIHDVKNPTHPEYGYDSHDNHEYTYEYFKPYIENIYGNNYKHCFNNDQTPKGNQGVLLIKPL